MPKNVIIVGMARSGTSLTARIFAEKGYFVTTDEATELMPGNDANPLGYWEALGLVQRNVEIFQAVGYEFHNTWGFEPISDHAIARIRELEPLPGHEAFVQHYSGHAPWLWKDPRLCLTLSYWWPMVSSDDTAVLLLERDADEIYRSFTRVKFVPPEQESKRRVEALISQHLDTARHTIRALGIPHLTLNHSRFFDDPLGAAEEIGEFFEIPINPGDLNVRHELNHSSGRGRVHVLLSALYMGLPRPIRATLKRLTPSRAAKILVPERRYVDEKREDGPRS